MLPRPSSEDQDSNDRDHGLGDGDGHEGAGGAEPAVVGEEIRERELEEPVTEEVDDGGGVGVAGAVKTLDHDHPPGIERVAVRDPAEAGDAVCNHRGLVGEKTDHGIGGGDKDHRHAEEKDRVVDPGPPSRGRGAFGFSGAEILTDQGGGGVGKSPRREGWRRR